RFSRDWSSDVCSSDLRDHPDLDAGRLRLGDRAGGLWTWRVEDADEGQKGEAAHHPEKVASGVESERVEVPASGGHDPQAVLRQQIGRASCREKGEAVE